MHRRGEIMAVKKDTHSCMESEHGEWVMSGSEVGRLKIGEWGYGMLFCSRWFICWETDFFPYSRECNLGVVQKKLKKKEKNDVSRRGWLSGTKSSRNNCIFFKIFTSLRGDIFFRCTHVCMYMCMNVWCTRMHAFPLISLSYIIALILYYII